MPFRDPNRRREYKRQWRARQAGPSPASVPGFVAFEPVRFAESIPSPPADDLSQQAEAVDLVGERSAMSDFSSWILWTVVVLGGLYVIFRLFDSGDGAGSEIVTEAAEVVREWSSWLPKARFS
jgi:hypothetical protein